MALFFRTYNPNWDGGYHLHPDERFLTMVVSDIKLPDSITQYFNTSTSPLNPYNYSGYKFFVYGNFPISIAKLSSHLLSFDTYDKFPVFGRFLSAFFDSLNILVLYFISRLLLSGRSFSRHKFLCLNLAGVIYTFTVLPLQLSHFFAVDTFLCFFLLLSFYLLSKWLFSQKNIWLILAGISYGLAFSSKMSAIIFAPIAFAFMLYYFFHFKKSFLTIINCFCFVLIIFVTFRIFQPYAFDSLVGINSQFIDSLKQLNGIINNRDPYYPPEIQYIDRAPIIYPVVTLILWGFGLPFSLVLIIVLVPYLLQNRFGWFPIIRSDQPQMLLFLIVLWPMLLICYQGVQFTNTVRYFLPIYPFFSLVIAYIIISQPKLNRLWRCLFFLQLIYFFAFFSIYIHPHSRVAASFWIYQNLPFGSKITNESWDDSLPLDIPGHSFSLYQNTTLPLYDPDTPEKLSILKTTFASTDYIIMSSNRLWGSISRVPLRYPDSSKFYQNLFQQKLGFQHLTTFVSYPGFNLLFLKKCYYFGPTNYPGIPITWFSVDSKCASPGIYLRDDTAEESFTVYDHPQVIIFAKVK